eukprot:12914933-Prorocentrum_lima.AAC.1
MEQARARGEGRWARVGLVSSWVLFPGPQYGDQSALSGGPSISTGGVVPTRCLAVMSWARGEGRWARVGLVSSGVLRIQGRRGGLFVCCISVGAPVAW